MADLIFYARTDGKLIGPYHPDEFRARLNAVSMMLKGKPDQEVFLIRADTYTEARKLWLTK